jgi:hypothetical protein
LAKLGSRAQFIADHISAKLGGKEWCSGVTYCPDQHEACLVFVCEPSLQQEVVEALASERYVAKVVPVGRFVNVCLNDAFCELVTPAPSERERGLHIIEHTSLVPVYPLNLATYRISVVGEWIRRALNHCDVPYITRFWVQDSARQVELVRRALAQSSQSHSKGAIRKGDHTVGRVFAEELMLLSGISHRQARSKANAMFPYGTSYVRRPRYADWISDVVSGWKSILSLGGIQVDCFDRDGDILSNVDVETILKQSQPLRGKKFFLREGNSSRLSYFDRSLIYYVFLLRYAARVVSVVSMRQRPLQFAAAQMACQIEERHSDDIHIIGIGDVTVNGNSDQIREGRFSCVDNLDTYEQRDISHLISRFLRARAISNLKLSTPISAPIVKQKRLRHYLPEPRVHACLLLDELPLLLDHAINTGDFTRVINWCTLARSQLSRIITRSPILGRQIQQAVDMFDPIGAER